MKEYLRVKLSPTDDVAITDYGILLNKLKRKSGMDSISEAVFDKFDIEAENGQVNLKGNVIAVVERTDNNEFSVHCMNSHEGLDIKGDDSLTERISGLYAENYMRVTEKLMIEFDNLAGIQKTLWYDELMAEADEHMLDLKREFAQVYNSAMVNDLDEYKSSTDGNLFGLSEDDALDVVEDVNQYRMLKNARDVHIRAGHVIPEYGQNVADMMTLDDKYQLSLGEYRDEINLLRVLDTLQESSLVQ